MYARYGVSTVECKEFHFHPQLSHSGICAVEIRSADLSTPIILLTAYRSPSMERDSVATWPLMLAHLRFVDDECKQRRKRPLVVVGDLNARVRLFGDSVTSPEGRAVLELTDDLNWDVLNRHYAFGVTTHIAFQSILDLALVSCPGLVQHFAVRGLESNIPTSDHAMLELDLADIRFGGGGGGGLPATAPRKWNTREFNREVFSVVAEETLLDVEEKLELMLNSEVWGNHRQREERRLEKIHDLLLEALQLAMAFSLRPRRSGRSKPWFNYPGVRDALRNYRRWRRYHKRRRNNQRVAASYALARKTWKKVSQAAKQQAWAELCSKLEMLTVNGAVLPDYSIFRRTLPPSERGGRAGALPTFRHPVTNDLPRDVADSARNAALALGEPRPLGQQRPATLPSNWSEAIEFLASEIHRDARRTATSSAPTPNRDSYNADITDDEVKEACRRVPAHKACGPDNIPGVILHKAPARVYRCLRLFFQLCFRQGFVPAMWKGADVYLLFKSGGNPNLPEDYRPISVTSVLARTFENVILDRLQMAIGDRIHPWQFGFQKHKSTYDCLFQLVTAIRRCLRRTRHLSVAFLDVRKAYDRVWLAALIWKLATIYRISGRLLLILIAFLLGRRMRVRLGDVFSQWIDLWRGVPQGGVLSPLLFVLSLDDLFHELDALRELVDLADLLGFADDLAPLPAEDGEAGDNALQNALTAISHYASRWALEFSPTKSAIVVFHNKKAPVLVPMFTLTGFVVQLSPTYKYLGAWLQHNGRADTHMQFLQKKVETRAFFIQRTNTDSLTPRAPVLFTLLRVNVLPRIAYGLLFLHLTQKQTDALDAVLARVVRRVLGLPRTASTITCLVEAGLPSTVFLRRASLLKFFHRVAIELPFRHPSLTLLESEQRLGRTAGPTFCSLVEDVTNVETAHSIHHAAQTFKVLQLASTWTIEHWQNHVRETKHLLDNGLFEPSLPDRPFQLYLLVDDKWTAAHRCRLRFNLALLQLSRFDRHLQDSDEESDDPRSPFCPDCPDLEESPAHLLFVCPRFMAFREAVKLELESLRVPWTLQVVLGNVSSVPSEHRREVLRITGRYVSKVCRLRGC